MSSKITHLVSKGVIKPPSFAKYTNYEVIMGSVAYGVSNDMSDTDIYSFCIPSKDIVFPHLSGYVSGFDTQVKSFDQFVSHHNIYNDVNYDIVIYSIVKYISLCMHNNPNMIDSLFVPRRCILHCDKIGDILRDNRKEFLHKGSWFKFKGYAYSQYKKCRSQTREGDRAAVVEKYGYDLKFAYHIVRLLNEIEQILMEHDLELDRNREQLKSIRNGDWTLKQIDDYFCTKEKSLEELYVKSTLKERPDIDKIRTILLQALEESYGSLDNCITDMNKDQMAIRDIRSVLNKYNL